MDYSKHSVYTLDFRAMHGLVKTSRSISTMRCIVTNYQGNDPDLRKRNSDNPFPGKLQSGAIHVNLIGIEVGVQSDRNTCWSNVARLLQNLKVNSEVYCLGDVG